MDLTSPISVSTWDGFLYALVVVEVSCHYLVERLLHTKEDTSIAIYDILVVDFYSYFLIYLISLIANGCYQ